MEEERAHVNKVQFRGISVSGELKGGDAYMQSLQLLLATAREDSAISPLFADVQIG